MEGHVQVTQGRNPGSEDWATSEGREDDRKISTTW